MAVMGDPSRPASPVPAGGLARLDADERARVAAGGGRRPGVGDAPGLRRAVGAVRHLVRSADARGPRGPAGGGRRRPRRARRAVEAGHGPERGRGDRRRLPRGRPHGPDEDAARRRHATRPRAPACHQPGAAPGQARALTYDQARELMLAARERRRRGPGLESAGDRREARARRRRDRVAAVLRGPAARRGPRRSSGPTSGRRSGPTSCAFGFGRRRRTRRRSTTTTDFS